MVHDPVEQGHYATNTDSFISQFIQFQLRADASGIEMLILLLYLAVQLDIRAVADKLFTMFTVQLKNV